MNVATVLTACGIETAQIILFVPIGEVLQQCLPLAVLKRSVRTNEIERHFLLQQCLPLAVLKHVCSISS